MTTTMQTAERVFSGSRPDILRAQRGYILLLTLIILSGVMTLGVTMMFNTSMGKKIVVASRNGSQSRYAAESAIAMVINRAANSVDTNGFLVEIPTTNFSIYKHKITVSMDVEQNALGATKVDSIRGKYDLLTFRSYANVQASATDSTNNSTARIGQRLAFDQYPLFQFAVYWEGVMLLDPGSDMSITGRVHCNSRVKLFPFGDLSLEDWLTSPCDIWHKNSSSASIRFKREDGVLGNWVTPPSSFATIDTPYYGNTQRVRVAFGSRVPIFRMPIGASNPLLIIQPKGVDDQGATGFVETTASQKQKYVYQADLIYRERNSSGTIIKQWYKNTTGGADAAVSSATNLVLNTALDTPSVTGLPSGTTIHKDSLYDFGDQVWMNATYVNLQKFFIASTLSGDQVIYLQGQFSGTKRDVFCLYNAATLSRNITFVSNCPIYVWGSYNSVATKSSAIVGDIITVLSKDWNPAYGPAYKNTVALRDVTKDDTVKACLLGGVHRARVHTTWNTPTDANYYNWNQDDNSSYSDRIGQPHNHMVFMEDWSSQTFTYSGSMVALWRCLYITGQYRWNPGNSIYSQPTRNYSFDTRYNQLQNMPPGTPVVVSPFNLDYYEIHEE